MNKHRKYQRCFHLPGLAIGLTLALAAGFCQTQSRLPDFTLVEDPDGWASYEPVIEITKDSAVDWMPGQDTPEAAVIQFYASLIRGDEAYKNVWYPRDPEDEVQSYQHMIDNVAFTEVRLLRRKSLDASRFWILIYMAIAFEGGDDSGEDEVEVERIDGKWWVTRPPQ